MASRFLMRNSGLLSRQLRTFSSANVCRIGSLPSIEKLTALAANLPKEHKESFERLMDEYKALDHRSPDSPLLPEDAAVIIMTRCNIKEKSADHKKVLEAVKSIKTFKDFLPVLEKFAGPDQTYTKIPKNTKDQTKFFHELVSQELDMENKLPGYLKGWQSQPRSSSFKIEAPDHEDIQVESFTELEEKMKSLASTLKSEMAKIDQDQKDIQNYFNDHGHFPADVQAFVNEDIAKKLEQFEEMNHEEVNYEPYWVDRTRIDLQREKQRDRRVRWKQNE